MVIDGKMLNITPLGRVVVPPPMADVSVDLGAPISCVAFACTPVASSCAAAVATSDLHIHLLGHVGSPDHLQPLVLAKLALPAALASSQGPVLLRHLCWLSPTLLTAVCAAEAGDVLWALRLSVAPGSGTNASVEVRHQQKGGSFTLMVCISSWLESHLLLLYPFSLIFRSIEPRRTH